MTREPSADACPLSDRAQTRNVLLIGAITALNYLATPATYVWIHATLCARLYPNATIANLPSTGYLVFALTPVLVSWAFPSPALFKRIMVLSNGLFAAMCAAVAAVLVLPTPDWAKIAVLIVHGCIAGATLTTAVTILFEVMGRGVAASRRGQALGLAYGVGPIFAVVASLGAQYILPPKGDTGVGADPELLRNYATVFALSAPIMALAAYLSALFVLSSATGDVPRLSLWDSVFGGMDDFLRHRVLRLVALLSILMFAGYHIMDNMMLYSRYPLDRSPEDSLGYQHSFRYTFKIASGFLLGWLLTRTNPKIVLLVSASFGLVGVLWARFSWGSLYLVGFGWIGAGELFGPYVTNYILACSPPAQVRRNMAFAVLLMVFAFPAGPLYGGIADAFGKAYGPEVGFRLSFDMAAAFIVVALLLMLPLPFHPRPDEAEVKEKASNPAEVLS